MEFHRATGVRGHSQSQSTQSMESGGSESPKQNNDRRGGGQMKRRGSQGVGDFKRMMMYEMMANVVLSYDYWLLDSRQSSLLVRSHQAPSFLCYLALPTIYK